MEIFSALLAICAGNSPVPGEFSAQRPVTRSFDVFFDLHPNKQLSKQLWGWWFETQSWSLWRHRNVMRHLVFISSYSAETDITGLTCAQTMADDVLASHVTRASLANKLTLQDRQVFHKRGSQPRTSSQCIEITQIASMFFFCFPKSNSACKFFSGNNLVPNKWIILWSVAPSILIWI